MKTIGLIASGKIEVFTFLRYIPEKKKLKLGPFEVYYFKLNGYEVFLVISDKKMTSARLATTLLIEKISPLLIITFGIAGAIEETIRVGDVICGNSTTLLENGVFEQYISLSTIPTEIRRFILNQIIDHKSRIFLGTIITVSSEQTILGYNKLKFSHPVLDMETLGIAQVAAQRRVPVFSLRGVTHNLSVQGQKNLHTIIDYTWNYDKNAASLKLLVRPWLIFKLPEYYKTKISVSNHVASTLFSLLQVLSYDKQEINEDSDYRI
ncbi:MAG TPA: hypothetical protein VFK73_09970 [Paludibacter sp.]|nr:hypothetical protein [Paludibacter sp.]